MKIEGNKKVLAKLISDYEEHRDQYLKKGYDETEFRNKMVDQFFKVLGWDVDNDENLPEYNRDVIRHYKLKTKESTTKPDYAFGLLAELKPLFFVEAKTPPTFIKDHKDSAHQIRRYGRSAGLAVSILTNFEEFAVYDCTKSPKQNDSAGYGRIEYFTYSQYLDNFDFFWNTFSKEAVKKGKFEKYIQTDTQKKGSVPPDQGFVEKLNEWREDLATNIGLNNKRLNEEDINYAVQLIIDRIIFLRFCEDRNIEHFGSLKEAAQKGITHQNLVELYYKADEKYNSGLFDFNKDTTTPKIKIDNKILKNLIEELYRPRTEYEFGVMPVEILGNAYEQFLGHVIKISPSGKAKIADKPEVKKAGGVFYTPQYIVEYIVENTVGKLIKGKTPAQISKIKIVDPACGSGSFLLGAFVCLLKYHSEYYWKKGLHKTKSKYSPLTPEGKLTVSEKKRILTNNLCGVDIDPNAVEVTKLSLLLKAMDGETEESIYQQMKMFHQRALPDLDDNIKCGNSLIGYDFFDGSLELDKEEKRELEKKLKPFEWKTAFPKIFKRGGFDTVIGNPPYVQMAMYEWFDDEQKMYLLNEYCSSMGRMNTFGFFIEKGINLLIKNGKLGYIIPNTVLTQEYYQELRSLILKTTHIENIVSYEKFVFVEAVVETTTLILSKSVTKAKTIISFCDKELNYTEKLIRQETFKRTHKNQFSVSYNDLDTQVKSRIDRHCKLMFDDIGEINQAIALKLDRAAYLFDKKLGANYKPVLDGREINRYQTTWSGKYLKYDINAIHSCKREDIFLSKEKIFFRRVSSTLIATLDEKQFYALNTLVVLNKKESVECDIKFILAVFNSKLINYFYNRFLKSTKKVFSEIQARQVEQLPFPTVNFKNNDDKSRHDEIVRFVETLLELNKDLRKTKHHDEIDRMQNRIRYAENKIDEIIYKLYSLTKKEISIVEKYTSQ